MVNRVSLSISLNAAGFGEASPEAKAAKHLHDFFTYVAVRIVIAQLEVSPSSSSSYLVGFGRNVYIYVYDSILTLARFTAQSYNEEAYADMMKFMENHSVDDGDKFCADLMRESSNHKALGKH